MLAFQTIVTAWCTTPITKKNGKIIVALWGEDVAEPLIHRNVADFIAIHTKGMVIVEPVINVGLVKCKNDHVPTKSQDALEKVSRVIDWLGGAAEEQKAKLLAVIVALLREQKAKLFAVIVELLLTKRRSAIQGLK